MCNIGDKINLNKAKVLNVKDDYQYFNGRPRWYRKVLVQDETLGKVWFKTSAKFSENLYDDNFISCALTVSGTGENIIFAKSPKEANIYSNLE